MMGEKFYYKQFKKYRFHKKGKLNSILLQICKKLLYSVKH